jgi:hypothetical protein
MDSFYYCFVSLTTIGFGDLVPERHEYIVLMLIYLGVGLAVTSKFNFLVFFNPGTL